MKAITNNLLFLSLGLFLSMNLTAQIVDVESSTQGIIFPRVNMTSDVTAPVEGMVVYQTSNPEGLYQYDGASWSIIGGSGGGGSSAEHYLMRGWITGASSTRYSFLASGFSNNQGGGHHVIPYSGTLTNLIIKPLSAIALGAGAEFMVRINGVDTGLVITFDNADGTTLKEDNDEVAVTKGDLVEIRMKETGGVDPTSTFYGISIQLKP